MIRAVIFDLGGVIVPLDFSSAYAAMEALCPYKAAEIPKRIRSSGLVEKYETGQLNSESFVAQLSALLDLHVTCEQFRELWSTLFLPDPLIPEALFADLSRRYPLILLSNTNEIHFENIRARFPLLRHFQHLVLSYQVGAAKPSRRIYEEAIARSGCRAGECFYTDDVPAYVDGAKQAGIDAVHFLNFEQLERELRARGIV
ncbi:MAG TPA: HAD family phosphatase [Bryobacteraceae bacterium]|nr:HAD family phosphatase [Bryobacteraceae bacterium]